MIYINGEQKRFETGLSFKYFLKERYGVNHLTCHAVYQITPSRLIDDAELGMLRDIFDAHSDQLPEKGFYLQPPFGQVSPWGLKFTQMVHDLQFQSIHQVERFFYISLAGKKIDFYTQQLISEQFKPEIFYRSGSIQTLPKAIGSQQTDWMNPEDLYAERVERILCRYGLSEYQLPMTEVQNILTKNEILPSTLLAFCLNPRVNDQSGGQKNKRHPSSEIFIRTSDHHYVMKSSEKYLASSGVTLSSDILASAIKVAGYALFEENCGGDISGFSLVMHRHQKKKKTWATYSQLSGIPIPLIQLVSEKKPPVAFSMGLTRGHQPKLAAHANIVFMGIPKMSRLKLKNDVNGRQDHLVQDDPHYLNPEIMRRLQAIFLRMSDLDECAVYEVMSLANRPLGYHMIEFAKKTGRGFSLEVDQIPKMHPEIREEDVLYQLWNDAMVLVVDKKYLSSVLDLIEREVCPYHVIGTMRDDDRMIFEHKMDAQPILDIPISQYAQVKVQKNELKIDQEPIHTSQENGNETLQQQLIDWLYHEDFSDPQANLFNIDVSGYGDLVQGMMVGPWQTAVNQVVILDHSGLKVAHSLVSGDGADVTQLLSHVIFRMLQYNLRRDQLKVYLLIPEVCTAADIQQGLSQFSDMDIQWKYDQNIIDIYANVSAVVQPETVLISPYAKISEGSQLFCIAATAEEGSTDRVYDTIIQAHQQGFLKAYVALDQCLWGGLLRVMFASRLGAHIDLSPAFEPGLTQPLLGALVQVSDQHREDFEAMVPAGIYFSRVAQLQDSLDVLIEAGADKIDMNVLHLRKIWSKDWISRLTKMARSFDEYFSVDQFLSPTHKGLMNQKLPEALVRHSAQLEDIKIAILRDRGSFGHFHLASVLQHMGLNITDVTYTDLIGGHHTLKEYQCLLLPGGATYGDEGSAGLITAKKVLSHQHLCKEFEQFFLRSDTLVLGFGNGGQILSHLQELIADANWPIPQKNPDHEFHSQKFLVDIVPSPCVVLKDLENTRLMSSFGCRFGHISQVQPHHNVCASTRNPVIDSFISVENNPLHNDQGAYGFTSESGRVSWFLFHPEYHVENHQYDYYESWVYDKSPWAQLFYTMIDWLVDHRSES